MNALSFSFRLSYHSTSYYLVQLTLQCHFAPENLRQLMKETNLVNELTTRVTTDPSPIIWNRPTKESAINAPITGAMLVTADHM